MAATREEILDVQGRAIELVASIDDERAREAVKLMSEVGFVLAMQERDEGIRASDAGYQTCIQVDDGYDPGYLTEQDEDADRVAEVVALNGQPIWQPEYDREAHIERDLRHD